MGNLRMHSNIVEHSLSTFNWHCDMGKYYKYPYPSVTYGRDNFLRIAEHTEKLEVRRLLGAFGQLSPKTRYVDGKT